MTITLKLTPSQQRKLSNEAKRRGMKVEEFALAKLFDEDAVDKIAAVPEDESTQQSTWRKAFDDHLAWMAQTLGPNPPVIPLEDMSRAKIYDERGTVDG